MKRKNWIVLLAILCFLVGVGAGYSYGFKNGVEQTIHYGILLAQNFIEFDVNEELVQQAIQYYQFRLEHGGSQTLNFNAFNISY